MSTCSTPVRNSLEMTTIEEPYERQRKLTEKGLLYNQHRIETNFKSAISSWKKHANAIESLLIDSRDLNAISKCKDELNTALTTIDKLYGEIELVNPDIMQHYESTQDDHHQLTKRIHEKYRQIDRDLNSHLQLPKHQDCEQEFDTQSRKSGMTNISNSSTSSKRILLMAQAAALQAERTGKRNESLRLAEINRLETEEIVRQAKHRAELEKKRQELEDERIANELHKTQVEIQVINEATEESLVIPDRINPTVSTIHHHLSQPTLQNSNADLASLTETLVHSVNLSRLPTPEPFTFNGDPMKYPAWKSSFAALIESRGIAPREQIHYLRKYLSGEAKKAVEGIFYFDTDNAYMKAREILDKRFGNSFLVSEAFRNKIQDWPRINGRDSQGLRKYADFLRQCLIAVEHVKELDVLNDCRENRKMLMKLPEWIVQRWSRIVANYSSYPSFEVFVSFITKEADIACNPITSMGFSRNSQVKDDSNLQKPPSYRRHVVGKTLTDNSANISVNHFVSKSQCTFCKMDNHSLHECRVFIKKTATEKQDFVRQNGLCFGCLMPGHLSKSCTNKSVCQKCKKRHPTCLHREYENSNIRTNDNKIAPSSSQNSSNFDVSKVKRTLIATQEDTEFISAMIVPMYLSSKNEPENEILVYALLDTQSDTTFILSETSEKLNASYESTRLRLSTMTSTSLIDCNRYQDLQVRGIKSAKHISLPTTYSRDFIPVDRTHIPTSDTARRWPHLDRIVNEMPPIQNCEVGLLIGYNCPQALAPKDFIESEGNEPYAQKTDLGWSIVGRIQCDSAITSHTNTCITKNIPDSLKIGDSDHGEVNYVCYTKIREEFTMTHINKVLESDFPERKYEEKVMSQDDLKFMKIIQKDIHKNERGYYEMPLPFKEEEKPVLPDNIMMARKRLEYLKKRMQRNLKYHKDYTTFMEDVIKNGDVEELSAEEIDQPTAWYIPHHGVYHPKKPEKIRVVFDCSARYKGTALNEHLLQGPDLTNSLIGVLCRFREKPIAIMGDIERMFHQFKVNREDRNYLRFLWWKDGNLENDPTVYRMNVHLFGATSSPGCANFGLKKIASDNKDDFNENVSDFITNDFYVDDGLRSFDSAEEAIDLIKGAREMCTRGNLRLHKFVSNSPSVMESIPASERAKEMESQNFDFDNPHIERALGIQWCVQSDVFQFRITLKPQLMTRRGILSTVASIYDPLGCISPFVLLGKQILQQMCKENTGWDEPLSEDLRPKWEQWLSELPELANLHISRCFVPDNFGTIINKEIHHFSDASFSGYGQCSYLRLVNDKNQVHCSLVIGKARVAPLKVVTIPRLELTAATVSVKMSNMLRAEMNLKDVKEYFWIDSQIVLGYINNDARRFHVFVANRIQQIKNSTEVKQWRYVNTENNPADHASRGLHAKEIARSNWFTGPSFLWECTLQSDETCDIAVAQDDPELRKVVVNTVGTNKINPIVERLQHFSDWNSAVNAVTYLRKFITRKKNGTGCASCVTSEEDRQNTKMFIINLLQTASYPEEMLSLQQSKRIQTTSSLLKYDIFLDEHGVIRVGGRLHHSSLMYGVKHPIILPKTGHIINMLIKHCHENVSHQGRGFTTNELRSNGYWIIGCSKAVSSYIHKCVTCRKLRGQNLNQKMANLPDDRLEPSPPFTFCAVDCFGPLIVKEGRKEMKKYGLLFTCMASRAVHIETIDDMSTDAFINGLRCFIALRGPVRSIRCDQGSNFVGATHVLKEAAKEINDKKIRDFLSANQCDFMMNSPSSSHMNGVCERQIRTTKCILTAMLIKNNARLDTSTLRTFLYEAMSIVNSRPLTVTNLNEPGEPVPLTPNQLLTMKSKVIVQPPGNFVREDMYARKRWRRVQFLANEFWTRWRKEYLLYLQIRTKWKKTQPNVKVGDVVLLKDEGRFRGYWKIARVVETLPSSDGLVRRVKLMMGDPELSNCGKRLSKTTVLERPIHKLVLLLENTEHDDKKVL